MAGDWIKMRCDLHEDPAVIGIAAKLGMDEFAVVGRLHRVWSWADRQTRDGNASSVTASWLDRYVCVDGFAAAMVDMGWLRDTKCGLSFPNFDRHNGQTAKNRALTARRAATHRQRHSNDGVTRPSLPEKRREEKKVQPEAPHTSNGTPVLPNPSDNGESGGAIEPPPKEASDLCRMLEQDLGVCLNTQTHHVGRLHRQYRAKMSDEWIYDAVLEAKAPILKARNKWAYIFGILDGRIHPRDENGIPQEAPDPQAGMATCRKCQKMRPVVIWKDGDECTKCPTCGVMTVRSPH